MNNQYSITGILYLIAAITFCAYCYYLIIKIHGANINSAIALTGVWLIVSFFIITLAIGIAKGTPRTKVKIPIKTAIVIFVIAGALFITAGFIGKGI